MLSAFASTFMQRLTFEEGMQKNGLSATPSSTPPWSAKPEEKSTKREI
jgi:hypothetical protein